ncbi:MAG: threonine synthase [Cytophagales bacterium]|nr:threonine synthase [Cytophagales bacterium]
MNSTQSHFSFLQCAVCSKVYPPDEVNTFASCSRCDRNPLVGKYTDLHLITKADIDTNIRSMWRYSRLLPVFDKKNIVSLGEGFTPILPVEQLQKEAGLKQLFLKDESQNPTGSFKARGMSMAISKAKELGISKCIVPTAGNAGGAMSAYCARAGMEAVVVMPERTPEAFRKECLYFGARVILEKGLINDCAKRVLELNKDQEYFDVSTLKEPYRLEGKKTMGYEIAEQMNWTLPDVILYPTGGGTGLIGMWKAFHEMLEMGWISNKLPRMIAVQAENCKPLVETWLGHQPNADHYQGGFTIANGLAVPRPLGERMILNVLRESGGHPLAVSEEEILGAVQEVAEKEGLLIAPEGAALWAALRRLVRQGEIDREEKILLLNTGSGYKYMENFPSTVQHALAIQFPDKR